VWGIFGSELALHDTKNKMNQDKTEIYKQMPSFIKTAIEKQLEVYVEKEIEEAKKRIDAKRAEIVAGIVLNINRTIGIESSQENVKITVALV